MIHIKLIIAIFLGYVSLDAQNYFDHLKSNYPVYGFTLISGYSDGAADVMQFKYNRSVFPQHEGNKSFWNPKVSWRNKYLNGDPDQGELFPLSTTLFVNLTDGWHLSKSVRNWSWTCAIMSYKQPKKKWYKLVDFALITLTRSVGWHLANEMLVK